MLTAMLILSAALRVVDDDGLDALTMRRLAGDLGVATMSLYSHVPNKDDLLLGVIDLATAEIVLPDPDTPPWDALRAINRSFRSVAARHPNLVPLTATRPPTGPAGLRTLEVALDALRRAGIDAASAATAYRLMASYVIGFVFLESGGYFRPIEDPVTPDVDVERLPAIPRILETAPYLAKWDADQEFEDGMDALIDHLVRRFVPQG
jgi:AcrR family transcriptional regulator